MWHINGSSYICELDSVFKWYVMCTIFWNLFPAKRRITRKIHGTKPYHLSAIHKPFSQSQIIKLVVTILVYLNIDTILVCVKQTEKQIWTPEQFPISTFHSIQPMFCMSRLCTVEVNRQLCWHDNCVNKIYAMRSCCFRV